MKKRILRYFKHLLGTIVFLLLVGVILLQTKIASISYGDNPEMMNWENDGPYVFFENDSTLLVNHIKGNKDDGFYTSQAVYDSGSLPMTSCYFNLDASKFSFQLDTQFKTPQATYNDGQKIFAVSDIESGYKAFRDLLINNEVIDKDLAWTFEKGHLVLVGDFVDRGFSTTQVLWFIYKLEQEAKKHGGIVHFILGNHELKNLHGNYLSASEKYIHVAHILGKQQYQLYDDQSFIGRWMASKNTVELINGYLFVHGGIHPEISEMTLTLAQINQAVRDNYRHGSFPSPKKDAAQKLISTRKGPSWYRGYFKDDLTQEDVELGLNKFDAKAVVVGHTIQSKVNSLYNGRVIAIDVKHPKDYSKRWPSRASEALLIENGNYYRVFDNGEKDKL